MAPLVSEPKHIHFFVHFTKYLMAPRSEPRSRLGTGNTRVPLPWPPPTEPQPLLQDLHSWAAPKIWPQLECMLGWMEGQRIAPTGLWTGGRQRSLGPLSLSLTTSFPALPSLLRFQSSSGPLSCPWISLSQPTRHLTACLLQNQFHSIIY